MARKRFKASEIINKLREVEIHQSRGIDLLDACKKIEVTEQTYYRWRREYGGMRVEQAKRLKALEKENSRLEEAGGKYY